MINHPLVALTVPVINNLSTLTRGAFWFCGKVIAEPMIIRIAHVDEDRVEEGK
jgi:hypothetical protein